VARIEEEVRAADPVTPLNERRNAPGETGRHAEEIHGHEDGRGLSLAFECERLGVQRHRDTLGRLRAARETGHPQRALRSDINSRDTGPPRRRGMRHASRGQADSGSGSQELATIHR
jgi:hypothetical protein